MYMNGQWKPTILAIVFSVVAVTTTMASAIQLLTVTAAGIRTLLIGKVEDNIRTISHLSSSFL